MRVPRHRPLAEHVERALRLPEPAHRVMDAPGPEPLLREQNPSPSLPIMFSFGTRTSL